ncbi:cAMP response protein [Novymonas esmeraldas]|uniref:EF-hand domain-containing family member C2 n=1 Tax=Novymonas esmeraldas TaxID=1808958 RepID=A0AAW0F554_9TRYP
MKNSVARTQPEKQYAHAPQSENLPLAIGASFHDDPINRSTLRKSHNLLLERKTQHAPHTEYCYNGDPFDTSRSGAAARADNDGDDAAVWNGWFSEEFSKDDLDNFVVRMLGYYTEDVSESSAEKERVRKVCISFFVMDDSVSITEIGQRNSGLAEARILSRRQVPKDARNPADLLLLSDFRIGDFVKIYGQTYHIVDMDKRSRRYFREVLEEELPEGQGVPQDSFSRTAAAAVDRSTKRVVTSDDMDRKRAVEQQLTGIYTKHSTEDIAITKEFLKNKINEHLTYLALWDDRGNLSGDLHYCVIRVFLENNNIEIAEARPENSGRWGGPILVHRQRVPLPSADLTHSRYQQHTYGKVMKNDYLRPEHLQVGETYVIYGKPFFLYDSDAFTRDYVKERYQVTVKDAIDITPFETPPKKASLFYPPPPNGFGSERETRSNWLSLVGKPARIDHEMAQRESGRVMNFSAKLAKPIVAGDENREFVISFHRETRELEIFERPRRNSGMMGGRFLAKGAHRKDMPNGTTVLFSQTDFQVGGVVDIYRRPFLLTGLDTGTQRILDGSDKAVTEDRIKYLVVLLKQQLNLKFTRANEAFLGLAPQGTLGYAQVKEFLRACSCNITDEEALLLVQNLSPGTSGVINYDDFLRIVDVSSESMDEASLTTRSIRSVNMMKNEQLRASATVSEERQRRKQLRDALQFKLIQRKGSVQEQFRLLSDHSPNSRLNRNKFRISLNTVLQFNVSKSDEDTLVSLLFDGVEDANGDITYKQFQEFVDSVESI